MTEYSTTNFRGECSDRLASRLLQVKMNILPHNTCRRQPTSSDSDRSHINNSIHLCIGSVPTQDFGLCSVSTVGLLVHHAIVCQWHLMQQLH